MNLNDMLVFAEVVDRGAFTAAAEAIGLPKSNISRKITRLEKVLGVQLLERTTRKLALTEIGRRYYEHCVRIREEIEAANTSLELMAGTPRGILRVCASVSVGQHLIAPLLTGFACEFTEISLDLRLTNRRVDLLDEGYDVAIRVGDSPDSNLVAKYLCSPELHIYAAPSYLEMSNKLAANIENLKNHRCLFMNAVSHKPQWHLQRGNESISILLVPAFSCDDFSVLRQLATDGLGIALLPDYMCKEQLLDGSLVRVCDTWTGAKVDLYTIVPSRKGVTPKIRVFLDYISDACKKTEAYAAAGKDRNA